MAKRTLSDLPAKVKVGYVDYKIETWQHAQADAADNYGETDRVRRIIRIDSSHSPQQSAQTLLHELLHTAWEMWELPLDKKREEHIVSVLSNGLATIWRDNKEVFSWIDMNLTAKAVE